jgi:hypothetical protein
MQGPNRLTAVLTRLLFPLELLSLGGTIFLMGWTAPAVWAMGPVYAVWLAVQRRRQPRRRMSPISYSLLADLYSVYWPLLLATLLVVRDLAFVPVLVVTVVWLFRNLRLLVVNAVAMFSQPPSREAGEISPS